MADTVRLLVRAAVVAALNAAGKPEGVTIHTRRGMPIEHDDLPAIVVAFNDDDPVTPHATGTVNYDMGLFLECRVADEDPDAALEPLIAWGEQALFADETLGGLAAKISDPVTAWAEPAVKDHIYGAARSLFRITYRRRHGDPEHQFS